MVEQHREIDADLTAHIRGTGVQQFNDPANVHKFVRDRQRKANIVHSSSAGPARHLMEFGGIER